MADESGKILLAGMNAIDQLPDFVYVGNVNLSDRNTNIVSTPAFSDFYLDLNKQYRLVSGQLRLQERALAKLFGSNNKMALFCFALAVCMDLFVILLCIHRGREYYSNNVRNNRQLVALLFINPLTDDEHTENEIGRISIISGAIAGIMVYVFIFRIQSSLSDPPSALIAFALIICGILFMALLNGVRKLIDRKSKPLPCGNDDIYKLRLHSDISTLFNEKLNCDLFRRIGFVRYPHRNLASLLKLHRYHEMQAWDQIDDYKYKTFIPGDKNYDIILTSDSQETEYYIKDTDVRNSKLSYKFAILCVYELVYPVQIPSSNSNQAPEAAYIITQKLIRLVNECILLKELTGNSWEYTMEDDILDYEKDEDDEK